VKGFCEHGNDMQILEWRFIVGSVKNTLGTKVCRHVYVLQAMFVKCVGFTCSML
jgi:hypothetical protein